MCRSDALKEVHVSRDVVVQRHIIVSSLPQGIRQMEVQMGSPTVSSESVPVTTISP
jgi:hypothetical protein